MSAYRDPLPPLPPLTRALLLVLGWILVLVGVIGLVLPGLQGILTILLGGALLSLVSHSILLLMRRLFGRWPRAWGKMLRLRRRIHRWLSGGRPDRNPPRDLNATDLSRPTESDQTTPEGLYGGSVD